MSQLRFEGQVAIVTGAGGGLGRAYALLLAERGCRVVVNDVGSDFARDRPVAAAVVGHIVGAGGEAVADTHDVVDGAHALVATAIEAFGGVDVVVNNAGIAHGGPMGPDAAEEWRPTIDVNLHGSIAVTGAAWPHLERSGSGRVVMTASNAAFGSSVSLAYSTAKASMLGLTRSLAGHGRRAGIGVNCIMPAASTRLTQALPPGAVPELIENFSPEAVASFVAWLCHSGCPVSGETFSVGGGRAARVLLAENRGVVLDDPDPADWGEHVDALMATDDVGFPRSINDEISWVAHNLGRPVPEAFQPGGPLHWERHPR